LAKKPNKTQKKPLGWAFFLKKTQVFFNPDYNINTNKMAVCQQFNNYKMPTVLIVC